MADARMDKIEPAIFFDAPHHVEGLTWCPWCGEPDTEGEFCDASSLRAFWADVSCCEFGRVDPRASNDLEASCAT